MLLIPEIAAGVFLGIIAVAMFIAWLSGYLGDCEYLEQYKKATGRHPWREPVLTPKRRRSVIGMTLVIVVLFMLGLAVRLH